MCTSTTSSKLVFLSLVFISSITIYTQSYAQDWEECNPLTIDTKYFYGGCTIKDFTSINNIHYLAYYGHSNNNPNEEVGIALMKHEKGTWSELSFFSRRRNIKLTIDPIKNTPYLCFYGKYGDFIVQKYEDGQWIDLNFPDFAKFEFLGLNLIIKEGILYLSFGAWISESQTGLIVFKYEDDEWTQLGNSIPVPETLTKHNLSIDETTPYIAFVTPENGPLLNIKKLENKEWISLPEVPNLPPTVENLRLVVTNQIPYIAYNPQLIAEITILQKLVNDDWQTPITIAHSLSYNDNQNLLIHNQTPIISYWGYTDDTKHIIAQVNSNNTTTLGYLDALKNCHLSIDQNTLYAIYKEESSDPEDYSSYKQKTTQKFILKKYNLESATSSTSKQDLDKQFIISPNPVRNTLQLKTAENIETLTILSIEGKVLHSVHNSNKIQTTQLAKGVYLLQIKTAKGNIQKQFVKQ
ncbi:MAG: T9SS type A sorting domain-containing protein [Aureispira sp.]|nr:T9SS type A sorting domain-containing protein [Aureispira sp.]